MRFLVITIDKLLLAFKKPYRKYEFALSCGLKYGDRLNNEKDVKNMNAKAEFNVNDLDRVVRIATNNRSQFDKVMRAIRDYDQQCTIVVEYGMLRFRIGMTQNVFNYLMEKGLIVN